MDMPQHSLFMNWSSGKDAAMALYCLQQNPEFRVKRLLTTVNEEYGRVTMHGLRTELVRKQAEALQIPIDILTLPKNANAAIYAALMEEQLKQLTADGFTHAGFGDIFLEDLKQYREQQLARVNVKAVFPLWKQPTKDLLRAFIDEGFKAVVVCVQADKLDKKWAGRIVDEAFLKELPANVDPCGENGEFHTFCFDGPIFRKPIDFQLGEWEYREYPAPDKQSKPMGFWFRDLLPGKG